MEDLIAVLPFGGTFDLVQLDGSTLRRVFEYSVHRYGTNHGEFLQVSGTCSAVLHGSKRTSVRTEAASEAAAKRQTLEEPSQVQKLSLNV